ncbi:MAG: cation:proton antiporter [Defluviitaleaceae bacterium]|nr:cation:proton antiporter [Defluviitaleaceae bacterium]MCL2262549.1 cation:proton antiporter [Defluviitaleaceae bacterium]
MEASHLFLAIALILLSTKLFSLFMQKIHLPQVVGALAAGILLGPAVFNLMQPCESISTLAEMGVIFLLFSAGMETDFGKLKESLGSSFLISVLGVGLALGGGFLAAFAFGKPSFESFFVGVVIASMSTSITVEALNEMGKLKTKTGTAILGASLFDDIFVIVILAVVVGMRTGTDGFSVASVAFLLVRIAVFFVFAIGAGWCVNKLFNKMYEKSGRKGRFSIFAVAYCFIMAFAAEQFGLADITGAYIAGIAFSNTRCVELLETKTHTLSYMLFTPVFLANIGLQTSFGGITGDVLIFTAVLALVAIFSKVIGCGLGAKLCKFTTKESLQVGFGMVARGEVSFVVVNKGILAGIVSAALFPSVIIVVLVTVLVAPLMLKWAYRD